MNEPVQPIRLEKVDSIERYFLGKFLLALIVRVEHQKKGITFLTPYEFSQQLAYMWHPATHKILPHVHNPVARSVELTQEVLIIRKGTVRMDLYCPQRRYLQSCLLYAGDVVLLASGGHGFKMLEEAEIIEVKQGPYVGDSDKTRFTQVDESDVRLGLEE